MVFMDRKYPASLHSPADFHSTSTNSPAELPPDRHIFDEVELKKFLLHFVKNLAPESVRLDGQCSEIEKFGFNLSEARDLELIRKVGGHEKTCGHTSACDCPLNKSQTKQLYHDLVACATEGYGGMGMLDKVESMFKEVKSEISKFGEDAITTENQGDCYMVPACFIGFICIVFVNFVLILCLYAFKGKNRFWDTRVLQNYDGD
jgi:hypothetical protein